MIQKILLILGCLLILGIFWLKPALAFCPICIAGTGSGLVIFYLLGTDNFLTGLFVGAFFISILAHLFTVQILKDKKMWTVILGIGYLLLSILIYFFAKNQLIPHIVNYYIFYFGYVFGSLSLVAIMFLAAKFNSKYCQVRVKFRLILLIFLLYLVAFYGIFYLVKFFLPLLWKS